MSTDSLKVLIVDDEPLVGQLVASLVERVGFVAVVVHSAARAVEAAAQQDIGLVITDLQMPERDGVSLCKDLRQTFPQLPIVAMSGSGPLAHNNHLQLALQAGAKSIIGKPFRMDEFYSALTIALGTPETVGQTGR